MSVLKKVPVIAIDGPGGVGKTTVTALLAQRLRYHVLVSGFIYRFITLLALENKVAVNDEAVLVDMVKQSAQLNIHFVAVGERITVHWDDKDISDTISSEEYASQASQLAAFPRLRQALLQYQRSFACLPGLVAEGRDMGTVVFPEAAVKIFLTATLMERARRRHEQLKNKPKHATLQALQERLRQRDERDRQRKIAPLIQAEDAIMIDTSTINADQVVSRIIDLLPGTIDLEIKH